MDTTSLDTLQHGPTLRFKAGDTVTVTLKNEMATCAMADCTHPASGNGYHYSQKTNLHTHGLHVSPDEGADDVFSTVEPGASGTYTYNIPSDHAGGDVLVSRAPSRFDLFARGKWHDWLYDC